MRRRKKEHGPNHERWLVSYADFITLMFAFFVVMFASSHVDRNKVEKFSQVVRTAFEEMGLFDMGARVLATSDKGAYPQGPQQIVEHYTSSAGTENELRKVKTVLDDEIEKRGLRDKIRTKMVRRGLVISVTDAVFFNSGSADLRPDAIPVLGSIAEVLQKLPNMIRIEGHTDNVPIHNDRFPSNWELSTSRATTVVAFLLSRYRFVPDALSAAGYAEYHPVAGNDTPEGRAANRRVDIVVLNQMAAEEEPQPRPLQTAERNPQPTAE